MKDTIFLIGFMGAGKSTVAKCLKEQYGRRLVEMDQMIERREQMPISRIFGEKGEAYFRQLETGLLEELAGSRRLVVSCGGGVPFRSCNVDIMRRSGWVIFLTATPETVYERVKNSHHRPLLEKNMNLPFITGLMEERREGYEAAADIQVSTDGRKAEEICEEIIKRIRESEEKPELSR